MADTANKFIKGAIATVIGLALLPTVAKFVDSAQNATGVSSTQSAVIGLTLTIFVLGMLYKVYQNMAG